MTLKLSEIEEINKHYTNYELNLVEGSPYESPPALFIKTYKFKSTGRFIRCYVIHNALKIRKLLPALENNII